MILVTGGTGLLGSHLLYQLTQKVADRTALPTSIEEVLKDEL